MGSAALILISGLLSLYMFVNPVPQTILPHWVIPLISFFCLIILLGARRGPQPENAEKGFGAILLVTPLLGLLFQLHYLSAAVPALALFESAFVPLTGLHIYLALVGNYVTTSKSLLSGLPTFWNLRSQESWRKSHRLLGYGTMLVAVSSCIAMFVTGAFQNRLLGLGLLGLYVLFSVYSWWIWRQDPDRQALYGTQ